MKKSEMISVKIGEDIENINASLEKGERDKINYIKERLQQKRESLKQKKRKK